MWTRLFLVSAVCGLSSVSISTNATGQERDLPEELRALAVVCSSGASIEFRGQIEGGIKRLFGKVLEGEGELEISKSETDFLDSFDDERLRLEARSVYNECVLGALQIVYNLDLDETKTSSESRLLVPDSLARVERGQRFALRIGDTISLDGGGIITAYDKNYKKVDLVCPEPKIRASNEGSSSNGVLNIAENFRIPKKSSCWITLYASRPFTDDETCVYSFLYQCR